MSQKLGQKNAFQSDGCAAAHMQAKRVNEDVESRRFIIQAVPDYVTFTDLTVSFIKAGCSLSLHLIACPC